MVWSDNTLRTYCGGGSPLVPAKDGHEHGPSLRGECEVADFSRFETFDNYCVAMFSFEYLHSHFAYGGGLVDIDIRSPRFLKAVASQDDIFAIEGPDRVRFNQARYQEKVMTRWRGGLDDRNIRAKKGT
ncbi:hypothetical protein [Bradyrhizobium iriomotense]|uniref:hypothetical protein n=1 Tax=Bradyrhizobium iriomotense TaxID=441950 RepID=UPI001B89E910|nr:hypothetical protein [Bradyrhizobium iriomotense]MBR1133560.1 hypothetical protein [Bradyrhizobium iriomotense]